MLLKIGNNWYISLFNACVNNWKFALKVEMVGVPMSTWLQEWLVAIEALLVVTYCASCVLSAISMGYNRHRLHRFWEGGVIGTKWCLLTPSVLYISWLKRAKAVCPYNEIKDETARLESYPCPTVCVRGGVGVGIFNPIGSCGFISVIMSTCESSMSTWSRWWKF